MIIKNDPSLKFFNDGSFLLFNNENIKEWRKSKSEIS